MENENGTTTFKAIKYAKVNQIELRTERRKSKRMFSH